MSVRAKIRLDFKAEAGGRKFFWQRDNLSEVAKRVRSRQVSLLSNLPFQGISVEDFNTDRDVYVLSDVENRKETAYAPLELVVEADSVEDLMEFTLREEFRKIKILEPDHISLSNGDLERLIFKVNEEYRDEIYFQD
ncbi:MAG: hypothetical protein GXY86_09065 [Firmicutes bacterium]|nr:hypothetical protein [Bacillota bacterium]